MKINNIDISIITITIIITILSFHEFQKCISNDKKANLREPLAGSILMTVSWLWAHSEDSQLPNFSQWWLLLSLTCEGTYKRNNDVTFWCDESWTLMSTFSSPVSTMEDIKFRKWHCRFTTYTLIPTSEEHYHDDAITGKYSLRGIHQLTKDSPHKGPKIQSFGIFVPASINKLLNKQSSY